MDTKYSELKQDDLEVEDTTDASSSRKSRTRMRLWAVLCHLSIFTLYTAAFGYFAHNNFRHQPTSYSPANEVLQYEPRTFNESIDTSSIYVGNPSPEVDQAWAGLLHGINTRISAETLRKLDSSAVALSDSKGGYWASMSVKHDLHCLNILRMYMAPEVYGDRLQSLYHVKAIPGQRYPDHISHCIERMRQFIMCNADPGLITWYWEPGVARAVANYTRTRSCVNWDRLHSWAVDRMFLLSPETIQNPEFGYPYGDHD